MIKYLFTFLAIILVIHGPVFGQKPTLGIPFGHTGPVVSFQFLPNGNLISTGMDKVAYVWDVEAGRLVGRRSLFNSLELKSVNGAYIAAGTESEFSDYPGKPQLVNLVNGKRLGCEPDNFIDPSYILSERGFSYDGKYVIGDTVEIRHRTYDLSGRLIPICGFDIDTLNLPAPVDGFLPSGYKLYACGGGQLRRWSYPELSELPPVPAPPDARGELHFFGNGAFAHDLTYLEENRSFRHLIWRPADGSLVADLTLPDSISISDVHPSGKSLLVGVFDYDRNYLRNFRYDIDQRSLGIAYEVPLDDIMEPEQFESVSPAIYSPDGKTVVSSTSAGTLFLLEAATGQLRTALRSAITVPYDVQPLKNDRGLQLGLWEHDIYEDTATCLIKSWTWDRGNEVNLPGHFTPEGTYKNLFGPVPIPIKTVQRDGGEATYYEYGNRSYSLYSVRESRQTLPGDTLTEAIVVAFPNHDPHMVSMDCEFLLTHYDKNSEQISEREVWFESREGGDFYYTAAATYAAEKVAIGTRGGSILLFDAEGHFQDSLVGHLDEVTDLDYLRAGQLIVSTSADGTIRLWDAIENAELATLLVLNEKDWVVLGPNNLFDASPGALPLLYFTAEYAKDGREIVELDQMKDRYYEPGLLQKLLGYSEVPLRSVKGLEEIQLYPKVKLALDGDRLKVELIPRSGGMGRVALYANGKELDYDARPNQDDLRFEVPLSPYNRFFLRNNLISVRAYNREESLRSDDIVIDYPYPDGPVITARGDGNQTPSVAFSRDVARSASLHVVCVGTSDYAGESIDLTFPNQDARAMSQALQSVGNALFGTGGKVNVHCLTTDPSSVGDTLDRENIQWHYPTKENIATVLRELQDKVKAQDVVVVYLSGHGKTVNLNNQEQFHYLTHTSTSANVIDPATLGEIAISSGELSEWLKKIPAYKQVVIIDACNAGRAIDDLTGTRNLNSSQIRALDRMSGRAGMYLIAGSAADMVSFEASNYGQGLLTYALLEGMRGSALERDEAAPGQYLVGVTELFEYAQHRVPELAVRINGVQQPQITYPLRAGSFAIGISNAETNIPLAAEKPIFVRSAFQSELDYIDKLGLSHSVGQLLGRLSKRGKRSPLVYLDVDEVPNAFRVWGRYRLAADGTVSVRAVYAREGKEGIPLEVTPAPADKIAGAIYRAITNAISQ